MLWRSLYYVYFVGAVTHWSLSLDASLYVAANTLLSYNLDYFASIDSRDKRYAELQARFTSIVTQSTLSAIVLAYQVVQHQHIAPVTLVSWIPILLYRYIKRIPLVKAPFLGLMWGLNAVCMSHCIVHDIPLSQVIPGKLMELVAMCGWLVIISTYNDLKDIDEDRRDQYSTFATMMGFQATRYALVVGGAGLVWICILQSFGLDLLIYYMSMVVQMTILRDVSTSLYRNTICVIGVVRCVQYSLDM